MTFYLLKEEVGEFPQAISKPEESTRLEMSGNEWPFESVLYVRTPRPHSPWWSTFLRSGFDTLGDMLNSSSAAVLLLRAHDRTFAVPFGYGRGILALDLIERDFGLKVALNLVDPETLRSVDARTFEELTVTTRTQTSQGSPLENFRISEALDIIKAVTGTPREPALGHRITGADAARLTYVPTLADLGNKCAELLAAYHDDSYKERFEFIDHMKAVRDPEKTRQLDDMVCQQINHRDFNNLHLAPPEVIDLQIVESFTYEDLSEDSFQDLLIEELRDLMAEPATVDPGYLRGFKIGAHLAGAAEPLYTWTLYDCVVAEIRQNGHLYVLSAGTWYQVAGGFADQVADQISVYSGTIDLLPVAQVSETEAHFNARAATQGAVHLLDNVMFVPPGARTPIELCDLLSTDRALIHVKRRTRSSTLSHLFDQGLVSAETFTDVSFRQLVREQLNSAGGDHALAAELIPGDELNRRDWRVVYAVVGGRGQEWPRSLPFFSQLNFKNTADRLTRLGYRVSLCRVPLEGEV